MAAGHRGLRYFVDETSLGLGKSLAAARRDVVYPGNPRLPPVPTGTLDTDWMPTVASLGLVVISRDRHIRTKPAELSAFKAHGLRVFWIAGKRDLSNWDYLVRVVRWWNRIEEIIRDRGRGPWFYSLNEATVVEIPV